MIVALILSPTLGPLPNYVLSPLLSFSLLPALSSAWMIFDFYGIDPPSSLTWLLIFVCSSKYDLISALCQVLNQVL